MQEYNHNTKNKIKKRCFIMMAESKQILEKTFTNNNVKDKIQYLSASEEDNYFSDSKWNYINQNEIFF